MTDHFCEVTVAKICNGPDDPRYLPCGKAAHFYRANTNVWMCADHWDEAERLYAKFKLGPVDGTEDL